MLSLVMALSFASLAFAGEAATSKTEAFINEMENGVGVKANISMLNGELFIKKNKAVANVTLGPLNAKAILNDGKLTAYLGIFKANLSELLPAYSIKELTGIVNEVPKAFKKFDTNDVFKYLVVTEAKTDGDGKFVENFGPNYEEIANLIIEENPNAVNEKDKDDIVEFCNYFAQGNDMVGSLLKSKASFIYEDASAKTLISAKITFPNEQEEIEVIDIFNILKSEAGINISYITVDIDEKIFKEPFAILNITWIIKLIIKAA